MKTRQQNRNDQNNDDVFLGEEEVYLGEEDTKKFAYRSFMQGMNKVRLIGKGGFALVYLAQ